MIQYLIDQLNQYTAEEYKKLSLQQENNLHKFDRSLETPHIESKDIRCLSSAYYLSDHKPLFISIHDEAGNANKHYHDFFEINYVIKGQPVGVIDNHEISFRKGNLIIMNPNAIHYYKIYKDNEDIILNIVLPTEMFKKSIYLPLLSDITLSAFFVRYKIENIQQSSFIFLDELDKSAENLINMLANEYLEKKSYNRVIIETIITLLFAFILRRYDAKNKEINSPIHDILDYIYQNYQNCTLDTLAKKYNYHPKYLSSLIHKHTGQSYRELIVNIKLQNALHYLLYSDYTVEEIIDIIGYKEKSSFYNCFKKHFNSSPGVFRNERKQKPYIF